MAGAGAGYQDSVRLQQFEREQIDPPVTAQGVLGGADAAGEFGRVEDHHAETFRGCPITGELVEGLKCVTDLEPNIAELIPCRVALSDLGGRTGHVNAPHFDGPGAGGRECEPAGVAERVQHSTAVSVGGHDATVLALVQVSIRTTTWLSRLFRLFG